MPVIYLRTQDGNNIIETSVTKNSDGIVDLSTAPYIQNYSFFLLGCVVGVENQTAFITYIENLSEIRGWLWEDYYMRNKDAKTNKEVVTQKIIEQYEIVAKRFNLCVVTD